MVLLDSFDDDEMAVPPALTTKMPSLARTEMKERPEHRKSLVKSLSLHGWLR